MDFAAIKKLIFDNNLPEFRFKQVVSHASAGRFIPDEFTDLSKDFIDLIKDNLYSFTDQKILVSIDGTRKALLVLKDGLKIETVLMQTIPGRYSICVSCQVGCAVNCSFCATGKLGFTRNLTPAEITDQFLFWRHYLKITPALKVTNQEPTIASMVFMGMGEPFNNFAGISTAIEWLHDYYNLGHRHITVSTSGIVPKIPEFAAKFPQLNLAISLHHGDQSQRQALMPIAKAYPLDQMALAITNYLKITNRRITFEYILIHDKTDRPEDRIALQNFLKPFPKKSLHINLIRYNMTGVYSGSKPETIKAFRDGLIKAGFITTVRKNLGEDIYGACGQLANKA